MSEVKTSGELTAPPGKVRWGLPVILLVSVVISYLDRNNLSFALPKMAQEFGWDQAQQAKYGEMLFIAFFFAYGLANMLFSPLGEKYGPKRAIMIAVSSFSVFTIMGAAVGHLLRPFTATRVLLGLGEGVHFPMNSKLIKNWFPAQERSRANGIWIAGVMAAVILAPWVIVPIVDQFGWRAMFVVLGVAGMAVTLPLVGFFVKDTPRLHPRISPEEIAYIEGGMEEDESTGAGFWADVKPILGNPVFLLALLGGILNNAASYGLINWLPSYFVQERGMDFKSLTWGASLPYAFGVLGIAVSSWLGDKLGKRVVMAGVAYLITAAIALAATRAGDIKMTVLLFSIAIFFQSAYTSQEFAILQRIVPKNRIGAGSGFYNGVAMMVGGVAGNLIIGEVVAATGSLSSGITALLGAAFLAGVTMLVLSRMLKY